MVSYSPKRAKKDKGDRDKLIEKLKKKLKISKKPKSFVSYRSKFIKQEGEAELVLDEDAVAEVAKFDGYAGIITNSTQNISVILEHYHGLWAVEESFRIAKHDLKMRPIYHQKNRPHQGSYCDLFCGTNVRETPELSVRNPIYKIISCRYSG